MRTSTGLDLDETVLEELRIKTKKEYKEISKVKSIFKPSDGSKGAITQSQDVIRNSVMFESEADIDD